MRVQQDPDLDLAVRCAWLSFIAGRTHEEIAARLEISRTRVTRLIQLAQRAGLVKIFVEGASAACVALEDQLMADFGLARCSVAPDLDEPGLPLMALGTLGARVLAGVLERPGIEVIGIGHGRTLAATVDALPLIRHDGLKLVSLLGSLTRAAATNPYDVIFRLADRVGGTGFYMPAPFFCDSEEDRAVFIAQRDLKAVLDLAKRASVSIVGIGAPGSDPGMVDAGMLTAAEEASLGTAAVGELLGTFIGADGLPLDVEINRRAIAVTLDDLRDQDVIAIAGGPGKAPAIAAVLATGIITHLVTDERTARTLAMGADNKNRRDRGGKHDHRQGTGSTTGQRPRQPT